MWGFSLGASQWGCKRATLLHLDLRSATHVPQLQASEAILYRPCNGSGTLLQAVQLSSSEAFMYRGLTDKIKSLDIYVFRIIFVISIKATISETKSTLHQQSTSCSCPPSIPPLIRPTDSLSFCHQTDLAILDSCP